MTIAWTPEERARAERAYQATREAMLVASEALQSLPEGPRARLQLAAGAEGVALARTGAELQDEALAREQADAVRQIHAAYEFRRQFGALAPLLRERGATVEDRTALANAGWRAAGERLGDVEEDWPHIPGAVVFQIRGRRRRPSRVGILLGLGLAALLLMKRNKN